MNDSINMSNFKSFTCMLGLQQALWTYLKSHCDYVCVATRVCNTKKDISGVTYYLRYIIILEVQHSSKYY